MTYRKRMEWPADVRQRLLDGARQSHEAAQAAEAAFKIRVYVAVEQGVTTREIAAELGLSQTVVSKYRVQGEALFHARENAAIG